GASNGGAPPGRDQSGTVGATIRDVGGAMLVTAVRVGGPADRAGIRPGFEIQTVDGCVVAGRVPSPDERRAKLSHWSTVTSLLRGPVGDSTRVRIKDGVGKSRTLALAREHEPGFVTKFGNLPSMTARLVTEKRVVDGRTIGIIRFNTWMTVLAEGISNAVDSLRASDAIVLDIRGNFGGMAMMAPGVAGHFIDTSLTLGTMIQRGGVQQFVINPQRVNSANKRVKPFGGPVAIVVDELSISTSEIFAVGMQALGRARIFGSQSAGQALPSVAEQLPNGDILYHAIANFLSPTGKPVEGRGVVPDVAVPITRTQLLRGRDPAFDAALAWAASSKKRVIRLQ
ncbi:MAG: S41 family peptidase, partial [Gemmatimonadaceae bacterium]